MAAFSLPIRTLTCRRWLSSRLFSRLYISPCPRVSSSAAFRLSSTGGLACVEHSSAVEVEASLVMAVSMEGSPCRQARERAQVRRGGRKRAKDAQSSERDPSPGRWEGWMKWWTVQW